MTNPIQLELFKNRFSSIAEEMGSTLKRTSFSPNIKERRDYSCALFDRRGEMIAQAAHIPVHLGSMPLSVKAAIAENTPRESDMIILNDPFRGGTHLPDVTLVAPVFLGAKEPLFFVANRAHHADIGGMAPGSMPLSTTLFQEGVIIPPLTFVTRGKIDAKLLRLILTNVRTPQEREGDFAAQIMANVTGMRRLEELSAKYGKKELIFYAAQLQDYTERVTKKTIGRIPDGVYTFEDRMDDDGITDGPITIKVSVTVSGEMMEVDFSGSASQVQGSINAVYAITLSAVLYVVRSFMSEEIPTNAGVLRPIKLITEQGSIVDAEFPAAVAGGNVETAQRIVDVLLGAFAKALPDLIPAAGQGTMNNIAIGGFDKRLNRPFAYYETVGGGMGASKAHRGAGAVQSHMTNTLNTPVEALEYSYPLQVTRYAVRRGTGGRGRHRGGDGIIREMKLLGDAEVTVLSERRKYRPYGLYGGKPGKAGRNLIIRDGKKTQMPGKFYARLKQGDVLRIETPGGGGFGSQKDKK